MTETQVATPEVQAEVKKETQASPQTFAQYKQKLKNEVEVAELRARIAKAYFEELAAGNQYNQLRAMLEAKANEVANNSETSEEADAVEAITQEDAPVNEP